MENKEDLDTELKKIQLRREQLSLKRELENEKLKQWILDRPTVAFSFFTNSLLDLKVLALRFWKLLASIALVVFIAASVNAWQEKLELEEAQAARNREFSEMMSHVEKTCGKVCSYGQDGSRYISMDGGPCIRATIDQIFCEQDAESNYKSMRLRQIID